jgi:hypothetical protein
VARRDCLSVQDMSRMVPTRRQHRTIMSVKRKIQDENVASYRRPTVSVSRKLVDKNAASRLGRPAGTMASSFKQAHPDGQNGEFWLDSKAPVCPS